MVPEELLNLLDFLFSFSSHDPWYFPFGEIMLFHERFVVRPRFKNAYFFIELWCCIASCLSSFAVVGNGFFSYSDNLSLQCAFNILQI